MISHQTGIKGRHLKWLLDNPLFYQSDRGRPPSIQWGRGVQDIASSWLIQGHNIDWPLKDDSFWSWKGGKCPKLMPLEYPRRLHWFLCGHFKSHHQQKEEIYPGPKKTTWINFLLLHRFAGHSLIVCRSFQGFFTAPLEEEFPLELFARVSGWSGLVHFSATCKTWSRRTWFLRDSTRERHYTGPQYWNT